MPRLIDADELDLLSIGAWILGTGGGGSPHASHLVARQYYEDDQNGNREIYGYSFVSWTGANGGGLVVDSR